MGEDEVTTIRTLEDYRGAMSRLIEKHRGRVVDSPGKNKEIILQTDNLTKHFGGLRAVDSVNLIVEEGAIHSIIGPNGAGKTTLFNMLTGFLQPSEGKIKFRGKTITKFAPYMISKLGIARTFQINSIFPDLTVYENVRIAAQSITNYNFRLFQNYKTIPGVQNKANKALENVGLIERRGLLAKHLSYGEKRRLEIAIALATEPKLLLLDEPTSGMSPEESDRFIDLVDQISGKVIILLIEHNVDVVLSVSHKITVMNQGKILAEGIPEQIKEDIRVQEAYLGVVDAS